MAVRNTVLLALVFAVLWRGSPAERVHFRIYTTDLLDQHTHTRTVFLKPEKRGAWNDKGSPQTVMTFTQYPHKNERAPVSLSSSTTYYPPVYLKTSRHPHPSQIHKPRPVRLVHPHQRPPPSAIVFSPAPSPLEPQRFAPLRGPAQISNSGCGAFVEGNEHVDKGNCFVEQYENGYRDEESRKTFYGDGNSNVNTEKHGERNSQNYRNEAVYHHDGKKRLPAPVSKDHGERGGMVKVKKYRTKVYYPKKSAPAPVNQNHDDHPPQNYRNEATYHYPDKKPLPIPENNENTLAPQMENVGTTVPPKKEDDEVDEEVPTKALYFKPLKNGKMKFIVRPSDIKYVKVQDGSKLRPGQDVKLVEITKSRKVLPGTKIDTVKIVENTEPLPEEDGQSDEAEAETPRKVRQKSKRPIKSYKNVKVREKITRVITPSKPNKSESKVKPLWVQDAKDPNTESGEDEDDDENLSLNNDSLNDDDDDGYKVHEEQAEASEIPSLSLTPLMEESVVKLRSRGRKPRHSVKFTTPAPSPSFEDSWAAAQTEIARKINEYWNGNLDPKPSTSVFGDSKTSSSLFDSPNTKARPSLFDSTDNKASPSLFDSPVDAGIAPRSFGSPFEYVISDSSERSGGKPLSDLFAPSSMQQEFFPSDPKHPVSNGQGKSEQAVAGGGFDHSSEDVFEDMPPLSKILATKGHIFKPTEPPAPNKHSFGASDPDRLESDAGVPVVEESSHKRKGYKETREHQLKSWR